MDQEGWQRGLMTIKIETYWNVNTIDVSLVVVRTTIKIETYWNVNLFTNAFQGVATD